MFSNIDKKLSKVLGSEKCVSLGGHFPKLVQKHKNLKKGWEGKG